MNHHSIEEIIAQLQKDLYCHYCGRSYDFDEIKLKGFFDHSLILQTVCMNGHPPVVTIFMTPYHHKGEIRREKVTTNDILDLHEVLENFSGDFRSLFRELRET